MRKKRYTTQILEALRPQFTLCLFCPLDERIAPRELSEDLVPATWKGMLEFIEGWNKLVVNEDCWLSCGIFHRSEVVPCPNGGRISSDILREIEQRAYE